MHRLLRLVGVALGVTALATQATRVGAAPTAEREGAAARTSPYDVFDLTMVGDVTFFTADGPGGSGLWRTDGTRAGTRVVSDVGDPRRDRYCCGSLTAIGDRLWFEGGERFDDVEVWISDGTDAGTRKVKDIAPGRESSDNAGYGREIVAMGGAVYFPAENLTHGRELWRSDGTDAGTVMVKDVTPGPRVPSDVSGPKDLVVLGDRLYFWVENPTADGYSLWSTDGTDAGTTAVFTSAVEPEGLAVAGSRLYWFDENARQFGAELWTSDGTAAGTGRVDERVYAVRGETAALGARLVFVAADRSNVPRLWLTDGTSAGTGPLSARGLGRAAPTDLVPWGAAIAFVARGDDGRREVWRTDGTPAGTGPVTRLGRPPGHEISDLTAAEDRLFFVAGPTAGPRSLWVTDGSGSGTRRVLPVSRRGPGLPYVELEALGRRLLVATEAGGRERDALWVTDGTARGTRRIAGPTTGSGR